MYGIICNVKKIYVVLLPIVFVLSLELVSFYPLSFSNMLIIRPWFALIAIYYIAVYAPWRFSFVVAFICGIIADMLFFLPLGVSALTFMLGFELMVKLRRFVLDKPFGFAWLAFALFSFVCSLFMWILIVIEAGDWASFSLMLASWILLVAFYPFVSYVAYLLLLYVAKISNNLE